MRPGHLGLNKISAQTYVTVQQQNNNTLSQLIAGCFLCFILTKYRRVCIVMYVI